MCDQSENKNFGAATGSNLFTNHRYFWRSKSLHPLRALLWVRTISALSNGEQRKNDGVRAHSRVARRRPFNVVVRSVLVFDKRPSMLVLGGRGRDI